MKLEIEIAESGEDNWPFCFIAKVKNLTNPDKVISSLTHAVTLDGLLDQVKTAVWLHAQAHSEISN
jgi:hypothetical protein